jgi:class 3 adenylate cyclase/CheY-like chemotaxis protein
MTGRLRAYVVDDEPGALAQVVHTLHSTGRVHVVGTTTDAETALAEIPDRHVEALFLDIHMPGITGFELLQRLSTSPPVVFVTAHDAHAVQAFEAAAVDYVLKPVKRERLEQALDRLERLRREPGDGGARAVLEKLARHAGIGVLMRMLGETNARHASPVDEFLAGARPGPEPDRILATVMFTDIVGATEKAAGLGDRRWRDLLHDHHALIREELIRFRGREIDTAGDGFLAAFDAPARAVRCALAVVPAMRRLGLEIRVGLHTGECEVMGDKLSGIALHAGARVASLAGAGEVLVSGTVKDLVAGSGIRFKDRGMQALKGVPGEWHLYAVGSGA